MRRLGFTVIELLVVISIIAVLAGLLIVGVGKLQTTAKRRQTEQVLANCQAMFGDWEAYTRVVFSREAIGSPGNVTVDLEKKDTSGDVIYSQYSRFGDAAVLTEDLIYHLHTTPTNATALAKMPANALSAYPSTLWLATPTAYAAGTYSAYQPSTNPYRALYSAANYICIQSGATTSTTPDPAYFLSEVPPNAGATAPAVTVPMLLDAWGNPIIFVPYQLGSGATLTQTTFPVMPAGALMAAGQTFQPKSPDGRPFFASAGPDGDFSQGDDNLYSFDR